jgi:hypothetical protein
VNHRTWAYLAMLAALPAHIQAAATAAFGMFVLNPQHPALRLHELKPTKKGRHASGSFSVSVTKGYRAIYVVRNGVNIWYWIGTHGDYDTFTGRK